MGFVCSRDLTGFRAEPDMHQVVGAEPQCISWRNREWPYSVNNATKTKAVFAVLFVRRNLSFWKYIKTSQIFVLKPKCVDMVVLSRQRSGGGTLYLLP